MPWPVIWVCALSLALLGCPEVHRREGLVDRSAHRDALERIPSDCTQDERARYCGNGREHSDECLQKCGGEP
ncbi:hypothetical protein NVS55_05255 [Myxococcus stipitatus]|uniref:hypothetical protein n=1 Tax=Myxococcus stipitatus TaxID=83455 RepID=UPI003144D58A